MSEKNDGCECDATCRCRCRKKLVVVALLAAILLAGAVLLVKRANDAKAEKERIAAERARIEAIIRKPLLQWTDADKAELPDVYEGRRQRERIGNSKLWTKEEKKSEWWTYTKLVANEKCGKVSESVMYKAGIAKEELLSFSDQAIKCTAQLWNKTMEWAVKYWKKACGIFSK